MSPIHQLKTMGALKVVSLSLLVMLPFQNCSNTFQIDESALSGTKFSDNNDDDGTSKDTIPPVVAILSPVMNATTRGAVSVSGNCEAGLDVSLTINGGAPRVITCETGMFSGNVTIADADGSVVIRVSQVDIAGNVGNHQVTINKDSTPPVVTITAPTQNASLTSQALNVTGTCETGLPVQLSGTLLSAPAEVSCASARFQASVSVVSTNGSYTLMARQTDAAGNQGSVSRSVTVNIPLGAPTIRISSPAANSATRTGITLSGTCTNGLQVRISGTGVRQESQVNCASGAFQAAITFSNGDGTKNIIVSQTNSQNTVGQDSRSFVLDTTPPAISILSPAAGTQADMAITVSGSCETGRAVTVSGAGVAAQFTTNCNSAMFSASVTLSNGVGSKVVTVSQTDAVGNEGSSTRSFERIAPVLDGQMLYANHCSACHGVLASSTKFNRTANQISSAINSIGQMNSIRLSTAQIAAIATALQRTVVTPVACNDTSKLLAPQVKRLTVSQFGSSIRNAFGNIFQDSQLPVLSDANPRLGLAADPDHLKIDEVNVNGLYESVNSLVTTIRASNSTVSSCISATTNTCFDNIITTMGLKLWRRPLTTADISNIQTGLTAITNAGASRQQRMDYILKVLLMAPEHLYRSEIGASSTPATAIFSLTQYEIASLLSFSVWDSPPDDTLLEAARNNRLSTKDQLKTQLSRMIANPLFARKMASFTMDILKIESIRTVVKDSSFGMTSADRTALLNSARTTLEDVYSSSSANFMAPFSTQRFHTNNLTARYFGVSTTGLNGNFSAFNADPTQRFGMLSHPAFLTTVAGEVSSGIVRRGVYALEQLLCHHLGNPPADISGVPNLPANWDPSRVSSREELRVAHSSQASCMGCHQKIDPAGFGFENYNTFGQFRMFEKGNIPIDSSGSITGVGHSTLNFSDSVSYLQALANSGTMRQCMEKRFFKYVSGETHETVSGQCEFSNFEYQKAQKGESIQALIESYIELESFSRRNPASQ